MTLAIKLIAVGTFDIYNEYFCYKYLLDLFVILKKRCGEEKRVTPQQLADTTFDLPGCVRCLPHHLQEGRCDWALEGRQRRRPSSHGGISCSAGYLYLSKGLGVPGTGTSVV